MTGGVLRVAVIDGYTDEPSSLGVPPYLAPLPRYIFGAVVDAGHEPFYLTIDDRRQGMDRWDMALKADVLVIIASAVVPGRYLATMPISPREAKELSDHQGITVFAGSCARFGIRPRGRGASMGPREIERLFDHSVSEFPDAFVHGLLTGNDRDRVRSLEEWDRWAVLGAGASASRNDIDHMVAELEASRGCMRHSDGGCSFCIEPERGAVVFREPDSVAREASALMEMGVRNIRLGGADIFSYGAEGSKGGIRPSPPKVETLLSSISELGPDVFHLDNADPGIMADDPAASLEILRSIVTHCTPGNVLALGLESADPDVKEANNLNATEVDVMEAVRAVNKAGAQRGSNGLPVLLPGLNFLLGLRGETAGSMELNMRFLSDIEKEGLMLRRINVRHVMWPGGGMGRSAHAYHFREFVREYEGRMIQRIVPTGTVITDVYPEVRIGKVIYGRQPASYPILVGIPYDVPMGEFIDLTVASHGSRSITAVEHPLDLNSAPMRALTALPGLGRRRASRIIRGRPVSSLEELEGLLDDPGVLEGISGFLTLGEK